MEKNEWNGAATGAAATAATGVATGSKLAGAAPVAASAAAATAAAPGVPQFPCGREGVEALLPHREPFVWVSRILECEPNKRIVAELDVDPGLELFKGHFPGQPVLPGVILMEALAQAASCCLLASPELAGSVGFLVGIDGAKFRTQVLPGDTVRLEATITRAGRRMCAAEVRALKGDAVCASATQKYILDKEQ